QGDLERAAPLFEEALALRQELGDKRGIAISFSGLADVGYDQADFDRAQTLYNVSLALYREVNDRGGIAVCLEGLARIAGAQRRPNRAARLFGAAEALREALGAPLPPAQRLVHDRCVAAACAATEQAAFLAALA